MKKWKPDKSKLNNKSNGKNVLFVHSYPYYMAEDKDKTILMYRTVHLYSRNIEFHEYQNSRFGILEFLTSEYTNRPVLSEKDGIHCQDLTTDNAFGVIYGGLFPEGLSILQVSANEYYSVKDVTLHKVITLLENEIVDCTEDVFNNQFNKGGPKVYIQTANIKLLTETQKSDAITEEGILRFKKCFNRVNSQSIKDQMNFISNNTSSIKDEFHINSKVDENGTISI